MKKILLDTSAWVEYFEGSKAGSIVRDIVEDEEAPFTSLVTIAELSDAYHRGSIDAGLTWREIRNFVQFNSNLVDLDIEGMSKAGSLKAKKRKKIRGFGLIDAIILQCSIEIGAKLLTSDSHLAGEDNAIPIT